MLWFHKTYSMTSPHTASALCVQGLSSTLPKAVQFLQVLQLESKVRLSLNVPGSHILHGKQLVTPCSWSIFRLNS